MKATLITGASSGIGEAFARRLAADKHNLVLVARSGEKLHQLCDELMLKHKITAHYVALDLTEFESDKKLFDETERKDFEIDWLVNNAGFGSMGDFTALELENELEMISLNVMALVALTHRFLGKMRERKSGTIINVASTAGFQPLPFMATYAATKAFVRSFSEAIAEENRPFGITVTALCPGPVDTNFFKVAKAKPLKAMQSPEEVVNVGLRAARRGKSLVISGWTNYLVARFVNFVPDSLITRTVGGFLRSKYQDKK